MSQKNDNQKTSEDAKSKVAQESNKKTTKEANAAAADVAKALVEDQKNSAKVDGEPVEYGYTDKQRKHLRDKALASQATGETVLAKTIGDSRVMWYPFGNAYIDHRFSEVVNSRWLENQVKAGKIKIRKG